MTNITLKNGFKFKVDENIFTDYEVAELCTKMYDPESTDNDIAIATVKLIDRVFGKDKKRLLESCRNKKTGIIPAEKPGECLAEVIQQCEAINNAAKN